MPSLQDLPSEINQKIFALVLDHPTAINLVSDLGGFGVAPAGHSRHRLHRGHSYNKSTNTWVPAVSDVALVHVSKKISADATVVLYTNNTFTLEHIDALERFLSQIGANKQYLRHIDIGIGGHKDVIFRGANTDHAFDMLKSARNLRSITFSQPGLVDLTYSHYPYLQVHEFVDKLAPLIGTLHASRKARNIVKGNILDLVKFWDPVSLGEDDNDDGSDVDSDEEADEDDPVIKPKLFKAALAARLGLIME